MSSLTTLTTQITQNYEQHFDSNFTNIFDLIYSIGSVYINVSDVNPGVLFGGVWERIKDKFLLCSGDTFSNKSSGGKTKYTLTTDNIPSHTHSISSTGAHTHTRGTMNITGSVGQGHTSNGTINGGWHNHNNKGYGTGALYLSGTGNGYSCTWSGYGDAGSIVFDASKAWTGETSSKGDHTHTIGSVGSGSSIDIIPPYLAVNVWQRIG